MFGEPPRTEYDLNFRVMDIPVRVHPFFWLISLLLGIDGTPREVLGWIAVVFVSILVHELGHAFVIRYFGWAPRIVLHSFGGLAIHDPNFSPWQSGRRPRNNHATQIMISIAGPAAGFLLACIVVALLYATQYKIEFPLFGRYVTFGAGRSLVEANRDIALLVLQLLYVNIFWGLMNLMPIYPLDGGQISRELFLANSRDGIRLSLQLSFVAAVVIAAIALLQYERMFLALMFGYMAYMNYQQLNGPFGGGFGNRW